MKTLISTFRIGFGTRLHWTRLRRRCSTSEEQEQTARKLAACGMLKLVVARRSSSSLANVKPQGALASAGALPIRTERKYPMKNIALALALVLAGSVSPWGLASTDANAGGRKICKQALVTHPMAGKHRDLMKQCKAEYKAHKKAA